MYEKEFCNGCVCHDCIDRATCDRCHRCIDGSEYIKSCSRRKKNFCPICGHYTYNEKCDLCGGNV